MSSTAPAAETSCPPSMRPGARRGPAGCASRCCTSSLLGAAAVRGRPCARRPGDDPRIDRRRRRGRQRGASAVQGRARPRAQRRRSSTRCAGVWLDNEVLYREGLALQVDKGDTAIRERVIFKALSVVDANLKLPPSTSKCCATGSRSNRAKYDEPARYDFQEAVLVRRQLRRQRCAPSSTPLNARHAGRREGRPARLQGATARQPRAELRRRSSPRRSTARHRANGARCRRATAGARCGWTSITPAKPAVVRGPARRGAAGLDRRDRWPSSAPPPCAHWPRSTR